jgi:hypothetical protein
MESQSKNPNQPPNPTDRELYAALMGVELETKRMQFEYDLKDKEYSIRNIDFNWRTGEDGGLDFLRNNFFTIISILDIDRFSDLRKFYSHSDISISNRSEEDEVAMCILFIKRLKDLVKENKKYKDLVDTTLFKIDTIARATFTPGLYSNIEEIE